MRRRSFCWGVLAAYGALAALVNAEAADAGPQRLLVLGDSLSAGYGLPADQSFPSRLQAALRAAGRNTVVINAGVSGDTSAGGLARLDWVLADKPHAALVELGANDGLRGLDPDAMRANLDAIVAKLRAAGIPVLLAGMEAPPNLGAEYGAAFRQAYRAVVAKHKIDFYPFFLDGIAADPALNQQDGMHPNALGVDKIVARILPRATALLDRAGP